MYVNMYVRMYVCIYDMPMWLEGYVLTLVSAPSKL